MNESRSSPIDYSYSNLDFTLSLFARQIRAKAPEEAQALLLSFITDGYETSREAPAWEVYLACPCLGSLKSL